jgi:hypothetical protein
MAASPFHHGKNGEWRRFANADADDSTMALWLSLLYRVYGPPEGMSPDLQQSLRNARKALLRLRVASGVFHYARGAELGYLMDNAEVLEALRDDCRHAGLGCKQADQLERAVVRVFWNPVATCGALPRMASLRQRSTRAVRHSCFR